MRKKTVNHLADTIFWYAIYFLPVISYLIYLCGVGGNYNYILFTDFINFSGFGVLSDSVIYTALYDIFGVGGLMPFFDTPVIFICMTWFVSTFLIHLFVDFVLFIPRLAHKWLNYFTKGDN